MWSSAYYGLLWLAMAANTRGAVIGSSVSLIPVASAMALATAAAVVITGGSPTPRAPNGPFSLGTSTRMIS